MVKFSFGKTRYKMCGHFTLVERLPRNKIKIERFDLFQLGWFGVKKRITVPAHEMDRELFDALSLIITGMEKAIAEDVFHAKK